MKRIAGYLALCAAVALSACETTSTAPTSYPSIEGEELVLDAGFDEVWTALVDYSGSTFFAIDNFEKESGLMTLSFGAGEPQRFIDCGRMKNPHPTLGFEGTSLDVFRAYGQTSFTGRMNLVVKALGADRTQLRVNARYVYQAWGDGYSGNWGFDTGGDATQLIAQDIKVTCRAKNVAERDIVAGIRKQLAAE